MKYSQVSDSLRNDGGQPVPFQGVIFFPVTAGVMLTVISMGEGLARRRLSALGARGRRVRVPGEGARGPAWTPSGGGRRGAPARLLGLANGPPSWPPGNSHLKEGAPHPQGSFSWAPHTPDQ